MGMQVYKYKHREYAMQPFRRASFFADQPSQGMVAEMYWNGDGVPCDRALAYARMDLAAERGYASFLGLR
jgi:TPR repeat protein